MSEIWWHGFGAGMAATALANLIIGVFLAVLAYIDVTIRWRP